MASGLAIGCTPKIVREVSSLYSSDEFRAIQKQVYEQRENTEDNQTLITRVETFFDCDYKDAREFIDTQKQVYLFYEEYQKDEKSGDPFSTVESSTQFYNAFYNLEFFINNTLDPKGAEELHNKFFELRQRL